MSQWTSVSLSEACLIKPPKKEAKIGLGNADMVSFVPMANLGICTKPLELNEERPLGKVYGNYTYFADNDVLLAKITPCFENGKLGVASGLTNGIGFGSSEYIVFRPNGRILSDYLFYFLSQDSFRGAGAKVMTGAVGHKRVPNDFIADYTIPLPPLTEQKRIVAILDDAFERIDTAIANTEKNLANARELFESYLNNVFTQKGEGWVEAPIEKCFKVKSGDFLPKKKMALSGDYDVYGGNGPTGRHDQCNLSGQNIVIGRVGAKCGNVRRTDFDVWLTDNAFYISEYYQDFDVDFLAFVLRKANLGSTANQTAQPVISYKTIKPVVLSFPESIERQHNIVEGCQNLQLEIAKLEVLYQQKLNALKELKQAILQKAFAGELTAGINPEKLVN